MSDRSSSLLRRFKTERGDKNNGYTWRNTCKTPKQVPPRNQHCHTSSIRAKEPTTKIQMKGMGQYFLSCSNHHQKKASYQLKESMTDAFCQECSIRLVKQNARLLKLNEKSLCLRAYYEAQMEKLFRTQEEALKLLTNYFQKQRETIQKAFIEAKESKENIISIPSFKKDVLERRDLELSIAKVFGATHKKVLQFISKQPVTEPVDFHKKQRNYTLESQNQPDRKSISLTNNKENIFNDVNVGLEWTNRCCEVEKRFQNRLTPETER